MNWTNDSIDNIYIYSFWYGDNMNRTNDSIANICPLGWPKNWKFCDSGQKMRCAHAQIISWSAANKEYRRNLYIFSWIFGWVKIWKIMYIHKKFCDPRKVFLQSLDRGMNKIKNRIYLRGLHHSSFLLPYVITTTRSRIYIYSFWFVDYMNWTNDSRVLMSVWLRCSSLRTKEDL